MNEEANSRPTREASDSQQRAEGPSEEEFPLDALIDSTLAPLQDDYDPDRHGIPVFRQKTFDDLEWSKLLEWVQKKAVTPEGEKLVGRLPPLPGRQAVERRLQEVGECMELLEEDDRLPLRGVYDTREALEHVRKEGTLLAEDLEAIGRNCDTVSRSGRFLENRRRKFPYLAAIGEDLDPCDDLRGALNHAIEPGGRLSDKASPDIGRLRRAVQNQHDRLKSRIDQLLKSQELHEHLQDDYFTIREDRYVLPVRVGSKSQVPGIVHGYSSSGKTAFVEPQELVEINNQLQWAQIELEEEKNRVLERLSRLVAEHADALERNSDILAYLDVVAASAEFGHETLEGSIPEITDRRMALTDVRHPLLWVQHRREVDGGTRNDTVTNDVHIDPDKKVLVVSGPNTGGKTVLLKAMGLCALMAHCGLPIPAEDGSELPLYDEIFSDIGDEQSIERDLSTFSGHLTNINSFLEECDPDSLVLLDELFTGTDPLEGAALATALLEELSERGATTIVTTHLEGLKTLALQDESFANASMGFDLERLEPTYRVTMGVPGSSFAIRIANRLGFPQRLVDRATEVVEGEDHHGIDEVIESLEDRMEDLRRERERLEDARHEASRAEQKYREKYESMLDKERDLVHDETKELKEQLVEAKEQIRERISQLARGGRVESGDELSQNDLQQMQEDLKEVDETVEEVSDRASPPEPGPAGLARVPADELSEGMEVYVHSYQREGTVTRYEEGDEEAQVQIGALKVEASLDELYFPSEEERRSHIRGDSSGQASGGGGSEAEAGGETKGARVARTDQNTLDLRGMRVLEATDRLEGYLDEKFLDGFDGIFIIHGHGTGALKRAVRSHLMESPYIDDFRPGERDEGGDGVTVASFVDEIER